VNYTTEECTPELRWHVYWKPCPGADPKIGPWFSDGKKTLQQRWKVITYENSVPVKAEDEWRDVPTVKPE
jgi:hypothetical protein